MSSGVITVVVIAEEAFEIDAFKDAFFAEFDIIVKLILTAIAAHLLNTVENGEDEFSEVKLAIAKPADENTPAEDAAPAIENTPAEDAAPTIDNTPAEEGSDNETA